VQELRDRGPSPSILAVAAVQFLGSLPFLFVCGIGLWGSIWRTHEIGHSPILGVELGLPFLFSLVAVITSVGLLKLREWARITSLVLATVPAFGCVLFLILYHPPQVPYLKTTIDAPYDIARPVARLFLAILAAVGVWWWLVFTRATVSNQFRR
jgi:hypothetical protein